MKPLVIRGTILALARGLHFDPPVGRKSLHDQFHGLQWWRTDQANRALRALGAAAIQAATRLRFGDAKTFGEIVISLLQTRLLRSKGLTVPIPQRATLFDAIQGDKPAFADQLWIDVITECEQHVGQWLTIYPLHKATLPGPARQFGNLRVFSAGAEADWRGLHTAFPAMKEFVPQFGQMNEPAGYGFKWPADTWLVAEHTGTALGAKKRAAREMSELIAVVFAFAFPTKPGIFNKSGADEESRALQVSDPGIAHLESSSIGELLPPLLSSLVLESKLMDEIEQWYRKRTAATKDKQDQALAAAAFLHHASVTDDVEQFLHLFIVVDALFGERHKVRETIKEGIKKVFPGDATWEQRFDLLMDLRSQLVHGVISDLEDWSEDFHYFVKFNSSPSRDAMTMATTALRVYFDLP
jgi:hypothetical protein